MERQVIFADYQEQTAADHNNLQAFARETTDDMNADIVTAGRQYAGFVVTKTGQAEVTVSAGRIYDQGVLAKRRTSLAQSMASYLAAAARRVVTVSVFSQENETDIETRDYLIDVDTGETEPRAVATTRSRDAVLSFTAGSEAADPQPPALPASHVAIAHILLDTTQVVSITQIDANRVKSLANHEARILSLEDFRTAIEPRVTAIASDVASLANEVQSRGDGLAVEMLYRDIARVKAALEIPALASDYGADRFLDLSQTDAENTQNLGYDAMTEEGIRFAPVAEDVSELSIFSANDPNAMISSGLMLPAYDHALRFAIETRHSDLGIAQYGFQTFDIVQRSISRQRIRYGAEQTVCTNSQWWRSGTYDPVTQTFRRGDETFQVLNPEVARINHRTVRFRQIFVDTYEETYWDTVTTNHSITGAQVAQTFLVGNDMWATRIGFYCAAKAANENVFMTLCEVTNGVPDLEKAILHQSVPHAELGTAKWVEVNVIPTFLKAGKRYAVVLTANANHLLGMASGQSYLDGTFFYSTDGAYYQGDLTKDLMIRVWGAKFRSPQVTIELDALSLSGGIQRIDLLAGVVQPASTELVFEVQPGGSGAWRPLTIEDLDAFATTPPLCRFRARFVGTRDMMPGLVLTGSEVKISRPKTAFRHISTPQELATASDDITVQLLLEAFDDTPHDCACRLWIGGAWEDPASVQTVLVSDADGRYTRTFKFAPDVPTDEFTIEITGSTNSPANTFHVAERVHWAQ